MKKILLAAVAAMIPFTAMSEGLIYDPWDTPAIQLTCQYPIEREDGTPLLLTEIGSVEFYLTGPNSIEPIAWGASLGSNIIACEYLMSTVGLADGQYYVTATTTDTDLRVSQYAADIAVTIGAYAFEISSYVKPPKAMTGLTGVGIPRVGP